MKRHDMVIFIVCSMFMLQQQTCFKKLHSQANLLIYERNISKTMQQQNKLELMSTRTCRHNNTTISEIIANCNEKEKQSLNKKYWHLLPAKFKEFIRKMCLKGVNKNLAV